MGRKVGRFTGTAILFAVAFTLEACLAGQEGTAICPSPIGLWSRDGDGQSRIFFSEAGGVRFGGPFEIYNPGSWELRLAGSAATLSIRSPSFTSGVLGKLVPGMGDEADEGDEAEEAAPDSIDIEARTIFYDLAESPCAISLGGLGLSHESESCSREREESATARRDSADESPTSHSTIRFCNLRTSVWLFAGGEAPRMRMIFSADGRVTFDGGFDFYNPAYWRLSLSGMKTVLSISSAGFDAHMNVFEANVDTEGFTYDPDSVHAASQMVYYELSESRCAMNFAGWIFVRQSELCND